MAPMVITVAVVVFIMVAVWWIEDRFGSMTAILLIGGLFGVICLIVGYLLSMANSRYTLDSSARFYEAIADTEKHRQLTYREHARGEREAFNHRAKLDMIDTRRVNQLADQRASMLVDLDRQKNNQPVEEWDENDNDGSTIQRWE